MLLISLAALALAALAGASGQQSHATPHEVGGWQQASSNLLAQSAPTASSKTALATSSLSGLRIRLPGTTATASTLTSTHRLGRRPQEPETPRTGGHRLGRADVLSIDVFGMDDLDRKVRVGDDGTIFLPLLGDLQVLGLTVREAEELITTSLPKGLFKTPKFRSSSRSS